jgi:hypothetical protein
MNFRKIEKQFHEISQNFDKIISRNLAKNSRNLNFIPSDFEIAKTLFCKHSYSKPCIASLLAQSLLVENICILQIMKHFVVG